MHVTDVKTILAFVLLGTGLTAAGSMLALLGRAEQLARPLLVKRVHRMAGYAFAVTLAALAVLGARILSATGDGLPLRGVLHWTLGSLLVIMVALKIIVVRHYKKLLKHAPFLGLSILVLAFLVASVSAGFFLVTGVSSEVRAGDAGDAAAESPRGDVTDQQDEPNTPIVRATDRGDDWGDSAKGGEIFRADCAGCHRADSDSGSGLLGLFGRERLASSGLPVSRESVRAQIVEPVGRMPSFRSRLADSEITALLSYIETL